MKSRSLLHPIVVVGWLGLISSSVDSQEKDNLLSGHPRPSYEGVENIDAMEQALRKSLAARDSYSFSRGWWGWDRLRARYVDGGRKDANSLKILRAVFRGLMLDWHAKLEAKGEGDLLYIFFTTLRGDKRERILDVDGRRVLRDVHGGGYHGGWGSAVRMRIYEELARAGTLTDEEHARFKQIVYQSLERPFIDFRAKNQNATNHAFGNAGGIAIALRLFPNAPQAKEARAWLDRIWDDFAKFRDWKEWTYYPYGPIFLHGMVDLAEERGALENDLELIYAIGQRCLAFVQGGGVRGNPNSGAPVGGPPYENPWQSGYYAVEQNARDGHFWYRMAQHFKDSEFLWAAEQVILGGKPPDGQVPREYNKAYNERFAWFNARQIYPKTPRGKASIGYLSSLKHKIPERLYLRQGQQAGMPAASFFLYEKKDAHLDNVSGHLYEYIVDGAKFLHTSGKYNNVYGGTELRGGGTGEESLDLLLVMKRQHEFPLHPDRKGDQRDFMRRGSIKLQRDLLKAENNDAGDSYGSFAFNHYYGRDSRWNRRVVLTANGHLVVLDRYTAGAELADDYHAGPLWHVARDKDATEGPCEKNWFSAPAFDYAWWQSKRARMVVYYHDDGQLKFGSKLQSSSQDIRQTCSTNYAYKRVSADKPAYFLSVLVPYESEVKAENVVKRIETNVDNEGNATVEIGNDRISIKADGTWRVMHDPTTGHPRASFRGYTDLEIDAMVTAVRKSRPQMHRGGWEWDRLLSRYIDSGRQDPNELKIVQAYFLSILDRYRDAQQAGNNLTLFHNHSSWGSGGRMRICAELVRQKMLTAKQQADFKQLVLQSLKHDFEDYGKLERGVNNRPYGINGGPALAVKMFASEPAAIRHKPWLDALWRELIEYGDTTETNFYPYGPLYLHGLLDMAEGMDKFETHREFLYSHARRYLDYIHGGGVRGNPNSGARVIHDREKIYADPWNAEYYADVSGSHIHNTFAKATVRAGRPQIWLSVLTPFDEGKSASDVAGRIKTTVDQQGRATATIGKTSISIGADATWSVSRL